jgi:IclR family mhp operon transcriptional activator
VAEAYKEVRSLVRGLRVMETLGGQGWVKLGVLSKCAGIDRSTTYRLVDTLVGLGYLMRRREDGAVALTSKVVEIADGVRNDDLIAQCIAPFLRKLTGTVLWPSDFASLVGGEVTIQASTHKMSPMSIHRQMVGRNPTLTRSALGRAILSAMEPNELDAALMIARQSTQEEICERKTINKIVSEVRKQGYASSAGEVESKISAIAVPVRFRNRVVGAINIVFFSSVMAPRTAADQYLTDLRSCVRDAERKLVSEHFAAN